MQPFNSILIANRGEIAVRVIRTAKALGYRTVAVYSDADADAPHVALADDAARIGPAPAAQSYLDADRILQAAAETGAEAIHPGYGFLSENDAFARACADAGLVFIGPPADAIELMGNKAAAKRRMQAANVPCVPGYEGEDQSDAALTAAAGDIGFPLMVKAAAGGGGRGMRLVERAADMDDALAAARSEAKNAFGSDELILEKAIQRPRHVEVQVFADAHGEILHMGERDCSAQRRHQKVIEEAPCPVMTDALRARMCQAAVEAARSVGYRGAGTVEFLLDQDGGFYFLEMNTRLQVEHPVTEMITGLDLVALQIKVAEGRPLGLTQDDIQFSGHAIEARLYAEDAAQDFLPSAGRLADWAAPAGEGVRVDAGVRAGQEVSPYYDPMIAKVAAWGETRDAARRRLIQALEDARIFGLTTNRRFLADMLAHETFAAGEATTDFIAEAHDAEADAADDDLAEIAAVLMFVVAREQALGQSLGVARGLLDWSSGAPIAARYIFEDGDRVLTAAGGDSYEVRNGDATRRIEVLALDVAGAATVTVDGRRQSVQFHASGPGEIELACAGRNRTFRNAAAFAGSADQTAAGGDVLAPMHGQLIALDVAVGDDVAPGARLAVLEAMKMQHDIVAEVGGRIAAIHCAAGEQAAADQLLIEIETDDA